ncbi:MAG: phage tail protein [Deltaproteobacteria bacterium]|nr:phage tail protein [Deltaproteobacteria bacterium]
MLQAFGLAVNGVPGQSYRFPALPEDQAHFEAMIAWLMTRAGDAKPNLLNADLIPFSYSEAGDLWDYAPNYLAAGQMGNLEAVVLMLGAALERGRLQRDWDWFNRLLAFILRDNLVVLGQAQLRTVTAACDQAGVANLVRLRYADYDRDSSKYCEARDQAAIDHWGEQALDLDFRYGSPVILEDPAAAELLASRLLQRLAAPQEAVEAETWLEGVRIELGDTVAVSSDFHGWDREEFTVLGRDLDLRQRRVRLKLSRLLDHTDSWAVDAAGSALDAWALDRASSWDEHWDSRAYVY